MGPARRLGEKPGMNRNHPCGTDERELLADLTTLLRRAVGRLVYDASSYMAWWLGGEGSARIG